MEYGNALKYNLKITKYAMKIFDDNYSRKLQNNRSKSADYV